MWSRNSEPIASICVPTPQNNEKLLIRLSKVNCNLTFKNMMQQTAFLFWENKLLLSFKTGAANPYHHCYYSSGIGI